MEILTRTPSKLKVAFLGGAYDSAVGRVHRMAIEADQRFELVAGCFSLDQQANAQSAQQYSVSPDRTYGSLNELLSKESHLLDAIVILTPTNQHAEQIQKCLNAGIQVISEKAVVSNSEEASAIKALLDEKKGFLAVTYNYTGYPLLRELQHMIAEGKLGTIQQIHIEMPQEGFAKTDAHGKPITPQDWRLQDGVIPTLSLDLGVHVHSIIHFLTKETPLELVATSTTLGNFNQVIDNISCIASYTNSLQCNIWYGKTALGHRNGLRVRVYGSQGSAEWYQDNPEYIHLADHYGRKSLFDRATPEATISNQDRYTRFKAGHPAGFIEAFANFYTDIADALIEHKSNKFHKNSYVFGIDESIEGLRMLESIELSSKTKSWVGL